MYKLFMNLNDGSNHVFYQNLNIPHLWLLASKGQRKIAASDFYNNLIELASTINDDLFTDEVASLISNIQLKNPQVLEISGPNCNFNHEVLAEEVGAFEYDKIFGEAVDRIEFYATSESEEYFKEHRKSYRAQYRNVTNILVIINVVVFVINYVIGYLPIQYIAGGSLFDITTWITILFAGFTHLSILHIFFNMSFLMSIGPALEYLLGRNRFLILYFFSLFLSGIGVVLFANYPTAGASGALYGLFAFFVCLTLKHETNKQQVRNVLTTFGINIAFTLFMPGISIIGHLGGIVAGVIAFAIFNKK